MSGGGDRPIIDRRPTNAIEDLPLFPACACTRTAGLRWSRIKHNGILLCLSVWRRGEQREFLVFVTWERIARQQVTVRRVLR